MKNLEEFILSVTSTGYGKRSSSYEYRVTGRGGTGIANMEMSERNKEIVSSFPIENDSHIMMVTDGGKLIRMPVDDIRIAGRKTQGVILFRLADNEKVVSVTWLDNDEEDEDEINDEEAVERNGMALNREADVDNPPEEGIKEPETVAEDEE